LPASQASDFITRHATNKAHPRARVILEIIEDQPYSKKFLVVGAGRLRGPERYSRQTLGLIRLLSAEKHAASPEQRPITLSLFWNASGYCPEAGELYTAQFMARKRNEVQCPAGDTPMRDKAAKLSCGRVLNRLTALTIF
jgi:hypothetical protein